MKRRFVAAGALAVTATAAVSQLLLPPIAEDRVRGELASVGTVTSVKVSSTPAVKMLVGGMDRVAVVMEAASLRGMDPAMAGKAGEVQVLEADIGRLDAGPVTATDVHVLKDDDRLAATGSLDVADVEELMPGAELTVDAGRILLDLPSAGLPLPLPFPVQLEVGVEEGRVVARARGQAASVLPTQPLLDRPELAVEGLTARLRSGRLLLSADARLTGA